jgi:protein-disulfide isomerase
MASSDTPRSGPPYVTIAIAAVCAVLGAGAGWAWHAHAGGPGDRARIERVVHEYLMAHPEVLPQAMAELERKQNASQLAGVRGQVEDARAGTVLGNPSGKVTLVEFSDYACTYCRHSLADVDALIAANPDLRVVIR